MIADWSDSAIRRRTGWATCSDEELMALVRRSEDGALEGLYDRHHRLALALAHRIVGDRDAAEEVVQEAFLSAWRQAATYRPERGTVKGWLLAVVRHRAIDRLRRTTIRMGPAVVEDWRLIAPASDDPFRVAERSLARARVRAALALLPDTQRQVIDLAFYGGLTHQQIAERTGTPIGTIKGRLRLAMRKLRLTLADLRPEARAAGCLSRA